MPKIKQYGFFPTLLPTLMVLFLLPLLVKLGFWQIHRGDEKNLIQKTFQLRSQSMPIDLNHTEMLALDKQYFPGVVTGHFDNRHSYLLDNKIYLHKVGYEVFTPFILNASHGIILVNRGWIPQGLKRKILPSIPEIKGNIRIQGLIIFPNNNFSFKQPPEQQWPERIQKINATFLRKNHLKPFMLVIEKKQAYSFASHWQPINLTASRHYAYAFQWFGLSLTLFIAFLSTHIRRL